MRLSLSILYFCTIVYAAQSQNTVTAHFRQTPLKEVFSTLERQGGIRISYDPALVDNITIDAVIRKKTTEAALLIILKETELTADYLPGNYVVVRARGVPVTAPDLVICGTIHDSESGEKIAYASISLPQRRKGGYSDENGFFRLVIPDDKSKTDSVHIHYLGYQQLKLPVSMWKNKKCPDIHLIAINRELLEVVVTDQALDPTGLPFRNDSSSGKRPVRGGFIPGLGEPDPFRMLQLLPGVAAEGDKSGELLIRGGASDQNLILWEGIPIYHTGHIFGVISPLNPYVVNRANVWKGNFGVEQGGRASGIVDLHSDMRLEDRTKVSFGFNLLSMYGSIETPFPNNKGGVMVAGRIAFSSLVKNTLYSRLFRYATQNSRIGTDRQLQHSDTILLNNTRVEPISSFGDMNGKVFWQPTDKTRLESSFYIGYDILAYRVDADVKEKGYYYSGGDSLLVNNSGVSTRLSQRWTENYHSEWSWAWSTYLSLYSFAGSFDSLVYPQTTQLQRNGINESVFRFDNQWKMDRVQSLRFGFQATKTGNTYKEEVTDITRPDGTYFWKSNLPSNQSAIYGAYKAEKKKLWSVEIGYRRSIFNYATRAYWEPRLNAWWSPRKYLRLKFNRGVYRQFMRQAYIRNDLGLNNEAWFTTDDNGPLPVLTNRQQSVGMSFSQKGWLFDLEYFSKQLSPATGVNLRFNGAPQNIEKILGTETIRGTEFFARKKWGIYTQVFSYTRNIAQSQFDSLNAGRIFPSENDQRHAINWTNHLGWTNFTLSLSWNYHSGRPYTPPTGWQTIELPNGSKVREIIYAERNSARLPAYNRMDISAQYLWKRRGEYSLGLSIFNLMNRANVQQREFYIQPIRDSGGNLAYQLSAIERSLLGRTVNLVFMAKW